MLTTAAWPAASRNRWPSSAMIQQPSPREATGKPFLKLRGKSPLRVGMSCPAKDCSRVASRVIVPVFFQHLCLLDSAQKHDIIRNSAQCDTAFLFRQYGCECLFFTGEASRCKASF